MRAIKFSGEYYKMPLCYNPSQLIQVFLTHRNHLSEEFLNYDTKKIDNTNYPLPDDYLIVLLLLTKKHGDLWTTVRRYTPKKFQYYNNMLGEYFEIRISGDKTQR